MSFKILTLLALVACALAQHAINIPGEHDTDNSSSSSSTQTRWGGSGGPAIATVPKEYICNFGSAEQDLVAYTADNTGEKRQCSGYVVDVASQFFIPVDLTATQFFDTQIPVKGIFNNYTIGGLRDVIYFPAFGLLILNAEGTFVENGRGNYDQGVECAAPASEFLKSPIERNAPQDSLTRDLSRKVGTNVEVAWSETITRKNSTDGYRQYFTVPEVTNMQIELNYNTAQGPSTGLTLVGAVPAGNGTIGTITYFKCDTGVPYTVDDFYAEYGPWGTGVGARRTTPVSVVNSMAEAIHHIVTSSKK